MQEKRRRMTNGGKSKGKSSVINPPLQRQMTYYRCYETNKLHLCALLLSFLQTNNFYDLHTCSRAMQICSLYFTTCCNLYIATKKRNCGCKTQRNARIKTRKKYTQRCVKYSSWLKLKKIFWIINYREIYFIN